MPEITSYSSERKFTFGKYKDQTVKSIMDKDPGYVLWVHKNVHRFPILADELSYCESVLDGFDADDYDDLYESVEWLIECEYVYRMRDFLKSEWGKIEIGCYFQAARKAVRNCYDKIR